MLQRDPDWLRHDQARWLRPDAHRWLRPDAERWRRPVHPDEQKYNPAQPRVPAGNPDGGQWTDADGAFGLASPMSDLGIGNVRTELDDLRLFQIAPDEGSFAGVQLAGDLPIGDGGDTPPEPPDIPQERPATREERMSFVRSAIEWIGRVGRRAPAADIFFGGLHQIEEIRSLTDMITTGNDPPATLEELQANVGRGRRGYDNHHIVEQTWAERWGFSRSEIDDPSNLVSIPRVRHIDITSWYAARNEEFGGLSPRDYLRDKSWEERRRVGLRALVHVRVLKP